MLEETNQMTSTSQEESLHLSLDAFFKSAREHQEGIQAAQVVVAHVQEIFRDEEIIAPNQFSRIISSMEENIGEPLQNLSALLESSPRTTKEVSPFRHPLLMRLRSANKHLTKSVELVTDYCYTCLKPLTQVKIQKQEILYQLVLLEQDRQGVLRCIEILRDCVLLEEKRRARKRQQVSNPRRNIDMISSPPCFT